MTLQITHFAKGIWGRQSCARWAPVFYGAGKSAQRGERHVCTSLYRMWRNGTKEGKASISRRDFKGFWWDPNESENSRQYPGEAVDRKTDCVGHAQFHRGLGKTDAGGQVWEQNSSSSWHLVSQRVPGRPRAAACYSHLAM